MRNYKGELHYIEDVTHAYAKSIEELTKLESQLNELTQLESQLNELTKNRTPLPQDQTKKN